jgi:peptide/nickel transport system substrate-binding protein
MADQNYWTSLARRRLSRRSALGGFLVLTGGAVGSGLLAACAGRAARPAQSHAGAGGATSGGTPRAGGTLNSYIAQTPPTLDAQKTKSIPGRSATGHAMSRLFAHKTGTDPSVALSMQTEPDLGLSAESPDALTWTVKLRTDAKFQDIPPVNGHPVEAEDVVASYTRALTVTGSAAASYLDMVDHNQVQAPAKDTVVFKLKYPYAPFQNTMAGTIAGFIFPREALAGAYDPAKQVIGSGPFIMETYTPDVALTFKRNPDWFDKPRPYIDGDRIAIIPDASQQLAQFTAGNLDELFLTQNDLNTAKQNNPKATVISAPNGNPYQLYSHLDRPEAPFQDIRLRQAISMALDRQAISKAMYDGVSHDNGVLSSAKVGWALAPDQLGDGSQYFKYNPDLAKKLVAESGLGDKLTKLVWPNHFPNPDVDKLAGIINPMLNAVGIKTQLAPVDYATQWVPVTTGVLYGHYDDDALVLIQWMSSSNRADEELGDALLPNASSNHPKLTDPTVAAMVTKMLGTIDQQERMKQCNDIQRYVASKMYYISGIPTGNLYNLAQARVRNYCYNLSGYDVAGTETYAKLWLES